MDLTRLAAPFPADDIEWLPGATTRDKSKAMAVPYIKVGAVQERLDAVCGPENWRNEFREGPAGGVLCGLSIRLEREGGAFEWVTKWDGADNTKVESVKGGISDAQKRAAVQWGIFRYGRQIPAQWVRLDDRGRFAETPRIPREYLPSDAPDRPAERPSEPASSRPGSGRPGPSGGGARPTPRSGQRRVVRPAPSGDGDSRPAGPKF